mmetsp:Transcript_34877/g.100413  ORF Transcript_34877/g.100413 Transcript_34877/m.100413 type:complete len:276 (+) Transcript_34877:1718-2545(+)
MIWMSSDLSWSGLFNSTSPGSPPVNGAVRCKRSYCRLRPCTQIGVGARLEWAKCASWLMNSRQSMTLLAWSPASPGNWEAHKNSMACFETWLAAVPTAFANCALLTKYRRSGSSSQKALPRAWPRSTRPCTSVLVTLRTWRSCAWCGGPPISTSGPRTRSANSSNVTAPFWSLSTACTSIWHSSSSTLMPIWSNTICKSFGNAKPGFVSAQFLNTPISLGRPAYLCFMTSRRRRMRVTLSAPGGGGLWKSGRLTGRIWKSLLASCASPSMALRPR